MLKRERRQIPGWASDRTDNNQNEASAPDAFSYADYLARHQSTRVRIAKLAITITGPGQDLLTIDAQQNARS